MLISNQRVSHPVPSWESSDFSLPSQTTHNSINPTWKCLLLPDRSPRTYCGFSPSSTSQVGLNFQKDWESILSHSARFLDLQSELSALPGCWRACAERHVLQPFSWRKERRFSFPRGCGRHQCHCFSPLLVSLQLAHSLPAGPGEAKRMNHIWHSSAAPRGNVWQGLK